MLCFNYCNFCTKSDIFEILCSLFKNFITLFPFSQAQAKRQVTKLNFSSNLRNLTEGKCDWIENGRNRN